MQETLIARTERLKNLAAAYGFAACGVSKATRLHTEAAQLENWLNEKKHGDMHYMENHFEKRVDPTLLVPEATTVISFLYNYYTPDKQADDAPKISMYAYGQDYHKVIKDKLYLLLEELKQSEGPFQARVFTDSAPVMERAWAARSGLGWIGKHTLLIHKQKGSYFFLGEIICNLAFVYDAPQEDFCGTCTRCLDACPTQALEPYRLDARKCISYATIELRNKPIPDLFSGKMRNYIFGCDICQDVCPWNRFSEPHNEPLFALLPAIKNNTAAAWKNMDKKSFDETFSQSPLSRAGHEGIIRNLQIAENK